MRFAGFHQTEDQWGNLVLTAVLRNNARTTDPIMWTCAHQHESRHGAVACAYQAEYQARTAGLLPDPTQAVWNDPATWPDALRRSEERRAKRHAASYTVPDEQTVPEEKSW